MGAISCGILNYILSSKNLQYFSTNLNFFLFTFIKNRFFFFSEDFLYSQLSKYLRKQHIGFKYACCFSFDQPYLDFIYFFFFIVISPIIINYQVSNALLLQFDSIVFALFCDLDLHISVLLPTKDLKSPTKQKDFKRVQFTLIPFIKSN